MCFDQGVRARRHTVGGNSRHLFAALQRRQGTREGSVNARICAASAQTAARAERAGRGRPPTSGPPNSSSSSMPPLKCLWGVCECERMCCRRARWRWYAIPGILLTWMRGPPATRHDALPSSSPSLLVPSCCQYPIVPSLCSSHLHAALGHTPLCLGRLQSTNVGHQSHPIRAAHMPAHASTPCMHM